MNTDKLRELALAATEGDWSLHKHATAHVHADGRTIASCGGYQTNFTNESKQNKANAAYIAAANPTAILELLDALREIGELPGKWRSENGQSGWSFESDKGDELEAILDKL